MGLMCLCNTGITCTCTCTSECMYFSAFIHHNLIARLHVHVCTCMYIPVHVCTYLYMQYNES